MKGSRVSIPLETMACTCMFNNRVFFNSVIYDSGAAQVKSLQITFIYLFNKKVCLHIWTFGIKEKELFRFFKCSNWPQFSLAHKLVLERTLLLPWHGREWGVDRDFNAASSFFDRSGCNFQGTLSMTRSWSHYIFMKSRKI